VQVLAESAQVVHGLAVGRLDEGNSVEWIVGAGDGVVAAGLTEADVRPPDDDRDSVACRGCVDSAMTRSSSASSTK
jgi:hypothetical protein